MEAYFTSYGNKQFRIRKKQHHPHKIRILLVNTGRFCYKENSISGACSGILTFFHKEIISLIENQAGI